MTRGGISKIKYVEIDKLKSAFIPPLLFSKHCSTICSFLIGKNKFIPWYTNESHTLANYHHLHRRWFYINFYQLHDEKHLFYPKRRQ